VADLLVGAVTAPLLIDHHDEETNVLTWSRFIIMAIESVFPVASQVNLFLIALERLHATLFPFRHCLITKWLYFKFIVGSWLVILLIAFVMPSLPRHASPYAWASLSTVTLLVLTVCYTIIIVNVRRSPHSQHHGSIYAERKLSVTLLMVTAVSVLTILPNAVYESIPVDLREELLNTSGFDTHEVVAVIYLVGSIVNPLVYTIRMQAFRKALRNLVCKSTEPARVTALHPHTMR